MLDYFYSTRRSIVPPSAMAQMSSTSARNASFGDVRGSTHSKVIFTLSFEYVGQVRAFSCRF
jgi:hypothetical protein